MYKVIVIRLKMEMEKTGDKECIVSSKCIQV